MQVDTLHQSGTRLDFKCGDVAHLGITDCEAHAAENLLAEFEMDGVATQHTDYDGVGSLLLTGDTEAARPWAFHVTRDTAGLMLADVSDDEYRHLGVCDGVMTAVLRIRAELRPHAHASMHPGLMSAAAQAHA